MSSVILIVWIMQYTLSTILQRTVAFFCLTSFFGNFEVFLLLILITKRIGLKRKMDRDYYMDEDYYKQQWSELDSLWSLPNSINAPNSLPSANLVCHNVACLDDNEYVW